MIYKAFFDGEFEKENIMSLLTELDQVICDEKYEGVDLYFSSNGGRVDLTIMLADYINEYTLPITIKIVGFVASAGLYLPMMCFDKVEIHDAAMGMIHLHSQPIDLRELRNEKSYSAYILKDKATEEFLLSILDGFEFTKEELDDVLAGKDVYLSNDRLKTLFISKAINELTISKELLEEEVELSKSEIDMKIKMLDAMVKELNNEVSEMPEELQEI
jgi:hypothetical protein